VEEEMLFDDIFLKAKLFMTFRYLQVRYWQPKPRFGEMKTFSIMMSSSSANNNNKKNAFVLNLDSDTERMQRFWNMNHHHHHQNNATTATMQQIQRYSAFTWQQQPPLLKKKKKTALFPWRRRTRSSQQQHQQQQQPHKVISAQPQQELWDEQEEWSKKYPWLASTRAKNGEKGCSLSHIRLLEDFVLEYQNYTNSRSKSNSNSSVNDTSYDDDGDSDEEDWYRFVFEDDAQIMEPLLSQGYVSAPADADVIFLFNGVTRAVRVPYDSHRRRPDVDEAILASTLPSSSSSSSLSNSVDDDDYAVRVITGFGTQGYVITVRGAIKFLHCLSIYSEPVDIVLLRSCSASLRIYLPNESIMPSSSASMSSLLLLSSSSSPSSSSSWLSWYKPQVVHDNPLHSTRLQLDGKE
jgi:GR25 family glycosyltransferase involved in LPS biosynthesis